MAGIFGPQAEQEKAEQAQQPIAPEPSQVSQFGQPGAVPAPQAQAETGVRASLRDFEPKGRALEGLTGIRQRG